MQNKIVGRAKRIRVQLPLGAQRQAWDCRPFGFGRIIAPRAHMLVELEPSMHLDLLTGEIRCGRVPKQIAA
jgi:hypothetical protein